MHKFCPLHVALSGGFLNTRLVVTQTLGLRWLRHSVFMLVACVTGMRAFDVAICAASGWPGVNARGL